MATHALSTPARVTEPPAHFTHSAISRGFSHFNTALARFIEAERDLECANCFDPAFADWLTDAETARREVGKHIAKIVAAPITRASDKPLKRSALLTQSLMDSETGAAFTGIYGLLGSHAELFNCLAPDMVARRVQRMLETHLLHLSALADLGEFADDTTLVQPDLCASSAEDIAVLS